MPFVCLFQTYRMDYMQQAADNRPQYMTRPTLSHMSGQPVEGFTSLGVLQQVSQCSKTKLLKLSTFFCTSASICVCVSINLVERGTVGQRLHHQPHGWRGRQDLIPGRRHQKQHVRWSHRVRSAGQGASEARTVQV